ncbi:MAG: sulfatase-like hydrolase/transferase [Planctomycetota bacterium]
MTLRLLLALAGLQLLTAAPLPWEPVARPWAWLQASTDLGVLMLLSCAMAHSAAPRRLALAALTALTLLVPLYRFGETLMPVFYSKSFEPWVDLLEVPGLIHLVSHDRGPLVQSGMAVGALAAVTLVVWLTAVLWRVVLRACAGRRFALVTLLVTQAAFAAAWVVAEGTGGRVDILRPCMLRAAVDDVGATLQNKRWHGEVAERLRAADYELAYTPKDLGKLRGADVYLLFVESYGRSVVSTNAEAGAAWQGWLREHESDLNAAGWQAISGWMAPSVHGGGSSWAHLEFLSGIKVEDRRAFDEVLGSTVTPLPAIARAAGYDTVFVQPAMPRPWPEAKILGFERHLFQPAFAYDGYIYHWGRMPDQFALEHVLTEVVPNHTKPLFLQYVSVSSHAPFRLLPPYHDDWTRAGDAHAFDPPAAIFDITWANYTSHPGVADAYLACLEYSLKVAFGFTLRLQSPSLVFVMGDHQPPIHCPDVTARHHDVPVHIVSNRPELLQPWLGRGFTAGIVPDAEGASASASRFIFEFLRAYGEKPR